MTENYTNEMQVIEALTNASLTYSDRRQDGTFCILKEGRPITGYYQSFIAEGDVIYGIYHKNPRKPVMFTDGTPIGLGATPSHHGDPGTLTFHDISYTIHRGEQPFYYLFHGDDCVSQGYEGFFIHAGFLCGRNDPNIEIIIDRNGNISQTINFSYEVLHKKRVNMRIDAALGKNYYAEVSSSGMCAIMCKGIQMTKMYNAFEVRGEQELYGILASGKEEQLINNQGEFMQFS